ncbi:hypothetical protein ACPPVV_18810 [Rhodanobacter sp. Col0626]|uniref:hypothetical protein n=1 Tax=Rhodanobacter sp. Col0626 TaxID=3415679 RepID=UPI003CED018E
MAAVYVGLGVVIGITTALESPGFKFAAAIIGLVGIISVFMYSRGLNPQVAGAHASALNDFVYIDLRCPHASQELREIQNFGTKACALQNNSDQMTSVFDLAKALHLGPTSSLVDSAVSLGRTSPQDYCAVAFKAATKLCPSAFASLSSADRETLTNLASSP